MVKKSWNIVNLKKRLVDNQSTKIKNKIAVKVVKLCPEPDLIINRVDLGRERYHKLNFEINLPQRSHLEINIFDPHGNILAHGISSKESLGLAFQTSYEWISVEIKAHMHRLNLYFYIMRIVQSSCVAIPSDTKWLSDMDALVLDSCPSQSGRAIGSDSLSTEDIWRLLPQFPIWDHVLKPKAGMNADVHFELLMRNCGNKLLQTFIGSGSKQLRENLCDYGVWAPLLFSLPLNDHYRHCDPAFLRKTIASSNTASSSIDLIEQRRVVTERFNTLIAGVRQQCHQRDELKNRMEMLKEDRLARIAEVEILQEQIMPDLENNKYYCNISDKKLVLESLKDHLMKDLMRQNKIKKISEYLLQKSKTIESPDKLFKETLETYGKGIVMSYNLLGKDLLKIEKELKKVTEIKERMEGNPDSHEGIDDYDGLIEDIGAKTDDINALTRSQSEIEMSIETAKSQQWTLFYSYLENIIKSRLVALYSQEKKNDTG